MMILKKFSCYLMAGVLLTGAGIGHSSKIQSGPNNLDNLDIATRFFEAVVNEKDFDSAAQYLGDWYIEHDPQGIDGPGGLKQFIDHLKNEQPLLHVDIKHSFVSGNYVIFHVHSKNIPGELGQAIVDIFRLDNGKVVEHWDVTQDISELSNNDNGMF